MCSTAKHCKHLQAWDVRSSARHRLFLPLKGKNVIFSDAMSSLQVISGFKIELDFIQRFIKDYSTLSKSGKTIVLCWIPGYVGISGYEKRIWQRSLPSFHVNPMKIPATDLVPCVTKLISEKWQQFWNSCTGNKLQAVRHAVDSQQKSFLPRRGQVVVNRPMSVDDCIKIRLKNLQNIGLKTTG